MLLLELAGLRIAANRFDIKSVVTSGQNVVFSFKKEASAKAKSLFANTKGKIRIPDPKTVYLRLAPNYFEPKTLITILRKILCKEKL
jgi:transcription-repair coupling factor (superfamily II helicase)